MPSRIIKWLIGLVVTNIIWVSLLSGFLIMDNASENEIDDDRRERDCLNSIEIRDQSEHQDIEQWTAAIEWLTAESDEETKQRGVEFIGAQAAFIARQYDSLPRPVACPPSSS